MRIDRQIQLVADQISDSIVGPIMCLVIVLLSNKPITSIVDLVRRQLILPLNMM